MRVIACCAAFVVAACHDPEPERAAPVAVAAPATRPPPDFSLGAGLEMRRPVRDGRVTIIPIALTADAPGPDVEPLQLAMQLDHARVRAVRDDYTRVRIQNRSDHPVLALSGELIYGADQDHAIAEDVVIPPRSTVTVRAWCVEQNREHGPRTFQPGLGMLDLDLLRAGRERGQGEVWRRIEAQRTQRSLTPPNGSYRPIADLQTQRPWSIRRDRLLAQLDDARVVGFAVAYDGEVAAIHRFASHALLRLHANELVASYVAGDSGPRREHGAITPDDVRRLAADAAHTTTTAYSTVTLAP
jgi:hypothetical protein